MTALEFETGGQPQYDFCLWEYRPPAPAVGKLRSINLLANSFSAAGLGKRAFEVINALREGLGDSRTVWGIKHENGRITWELYFYDYARTERDRSIPKVLELIRPWVPCSIPTSERQPYFMFSLDLDRPQLVEGSALEDIQMYIGNIGSTVSSGICYEVTRDAMKLKNLYYFFDARSEMDNIVGKLTSSVHLDVPGFELDSVLWPELRSCQTIVVSNKQQRDGVYFSRIDIDQLLIFLERMRDPDNHVRFIAEHRKSLDHMLYDVGLDFRVQDGSLQIVKSAYYGVF
jgi:hypothetical protein